MTKAEEYRKRAAVVAKSARKRKVKGDRAPLEKKAQALTDMAANEDWLDGTILPKPKSPAK